VGTPAIRHIHVNKDHETSNSRTSSFANFETVPYRTFMELNSDKNEPKSGVTCKKTVVLQNSKRLL